MPIFFIILSAILSVFGGVFLAVGLLNKRDRNFLLIMGSIFALAALLIAWNVTKFGETRIGCVKENYYEITRMTNEFPSKSYMTECVQEGLEVYVDKGYSTLGIWEKVR